MNLKERDLINKMATKICSNKECVQREKPIDEFPSKGNQCKACINEKERKRREDRKKLDENKKANPTTDDLVATKTCRQCNQIKPASEFRPCRGKCHDCEKAYGRSYRSSERGKEKSKEWIENNQELFKTLQANHYQANKTRINQTNVDRYHNDELYALRHLARQHMAQAIKKTTLKPINRPELSCTDIFFRKWIEYNYNGTTIILENFGDWHLDHVIPIAYFDFDDLDQREICFSWYNVSPYDAQKNMNKKSGVDKEQLKDHLRSLKEFLKNNNMTMDPRYEKVCVQILTA